MTMIVWKFSFCSLHFQRWFQFLEKTLIWFRLYVVGFSKNVIAWFKSYLSEQKFKANISTSYSSPSNLICSVPQGSILVPRMFFALYKWLAKAVFSDSLLYADDTCIVFQHKNVTEIEKQLLRDFSSLCDWFVDNKLSVNFGQEKAKSILFGTKHNLRNAKPLNIVYNGTEIKQYEKLKYLRCILDQSLSGESMALNVFYIYKTVFNIPFA